MIFVFNIEYGSLGTVNGPVILMILFSLNKCMLCNWLRDDLEACNMDTSSRVLLCLCGCGFCLRLLLDICLPMVTS